MTETSPVEEIFFAALKKHDPEERAAFLDDACVGRPELRARVEKLLAAHPRVGAFLNQNAEATGAFSPSAESEGMVIAGRYKLLQQIGEGGMGTVWMADQTEPVKRRVAIKLIRIERGQSKTVLSRFEAERLAIALMDHPNIAKLLDAGTTESGSPFFVMELVKGKPMNDYCDVHRLSIPERLRLFTQVCSAVQHAHQKGVIHRDLKPSNILVERHDDQPVPKVIDFGLAKATSGMQLTENTLFTGFGTVMGTPLYMAPEQAQFNAVDVDTRADVYALGAILYELLTGTTPITRETVKKAAFDEMLKLVREQEAPTPSSRLSSTEAMPTIAANRQSEPIKLGRIVKGELDWIVLKALAKERDRRYETANGFAKDIERFLNKEAVAAGPPTAGYRIRKYVQRHRGPVVATSLVFLSLVTGLLAASYGFYRADVLRQLAEAAEKSAVENALKATQAAEAEKAAKLDADSKRKQTEASLAYSKKANEILGSIFVDLDPKKIAASGEPLQVLLTKNLKKAVTELEGEAIGDPLTVAQMQLTFCKCLFSLGEFQAALFLGEKALETHRRLLKKTDPALIECIQNVGTLYAHAGWPKRALPLPQEGLKLATDVHSPKHISIESINGSLGIAYLSGGKPKQAIPYLLRSFELRKENLGPRPC